MKEIERHSGRGGSARHLHHKCIRLENMVANMLGRFSDKLKYAKRDAFLMGVKQDRLVCNRRLEIVGWSRIDQKH